MKEQGSGLTIDSQQSQFWQGMLAVTECRWSDPTPAPRNFPTSSYSLQIAR